MTAALGERMRTAFAPPSYLSLPYSGVDLSTSGVKAVRLRETAHGLVLSGYGEARIVSGAYANGDIVDHASVAKAVRAACQASGVTVANAALPESKSYLFETEAPGRSKPEWRTSVEQHLDEFVPLPPSETTFDLVSVGKGASGTALVGIGLARRVVEETLSVFDDAGIVVRALEAEMFAVARALLPPADDSTALIIDVGKTTTKLSIVETRVPRFATTINIGGHALTLAVQKHFGVTELEARKVKAEHGIMPAPGNEDYLAAMLSSVAAIRDEISERLEYWQGRAGEGGMHTKVERAILIGGNASVRGLSEYLEGALQIPTMTGDVFTNLASRDEWIPELERGESLAYATAIGLALYDRASAYA